MTAHRRQPPRVPEVTLPPVPKEPAQTGIWLQRVLQNIQAALEALRRGQTDAYGSAPASHAETHLQTGDDPLTAPGTPRTVLVGDSSDADPGSGPGYMLENAQLVVGAATPANPVKVGGTAAEGSALTVARSDAQFVITAATPAGLANSNVAGTANTGLRGDCQFKRDVRVQNSGGDVGTRNALRLLAGAGITRTVTDNGGSDRVEDTVAMSVPTAKGRFPIHNGTTITEQTAGADYTIPEYLAAAGTGMQASTLATILGRLIPNEGDVVATDNTGTPVRVSLYANGYAVWSDSTQHPPIRCGAGWPWKGRFVRDDVVDSTAAELFRVTVANLTDQGGFQVQCGIDVYYGNDQQREDCRVTFQALKDGGGAISTGLGTKAEVLQTLTAGTLTVTFSLVTSGDDVLLKVAVNSSLNATYDYCAVHFKFSEMSYELPVTFPAEVFFA